MADVIGLKSSCERLRGQRVSLSSQLAECSAKLESARTRAENVDLARAFVRRVAANTQEQLRYHITDLGSMALSSVFGSDIGLGLEFREVYGKTSATLVFNRVGPDGVAHHTDPLDGDSGGACDISGVVLRCSMWSLQYPRTRPFMCWDEPLQNVNDPTREMHQRAAEMIHQLSRPVPDGLGIQMLVVSMVGELAEVADNVVEV